MRYVGAIVAVGLISGICSSSVAPVVRPNTVLPWRVNSYGCKLVPVVSTGFAIDGGWVITAAHATRGASSFDIEGTTATLVAIDLRSDVAVLRPLSPVAAGASGRDAPLRWPRRRPTH